MARSLENPILLYDWPSLIVSATACTRQLASSSARRGFEAFEAFEAFATFGAGAVDGGGWASESGGCTSEGSRGGGMKHFSSMRIFSYGVVSGWGDAHQVESIPGH